MGRKRKAVVKLERADIKIEFDLVEDGLPIFENYIDVIFDKDIGKKHAYTSRLFFTYPTDEEIAETCELYMRSNKTLRVINAKMPYNNLGKSAYPLFEYAVDLGFNEKFSQDLCRLVMNKYKGINRSTANIQTSVSYVKEFVDFLSREVKSKNNFRITDISKELWLEYVELIEKGPRVAVRSIFSLVRDIFVKFEPTSLNGALRNLLVSRKEKDKPSFEHTSEFFKDKSYTDSEIYQMIALFISFVTKHTEARIHYEGLSVNKMPGDWLSPEKVSHLIKNDKKELALAVDELLSHEDNDDVNIDTALMWEKLSEMRWVHKLEWIASSKSRVEENLIGLFVQRMAARFCYNWAAPYSFVDFFTNKGKNAFRHQHGFSLANLLMLYTGANKGTVLKIPSRAEDGSSILERKQSVYVKADGSDREIEIYGYKTRCAKKTIKKEYIQIPVNSPIYSMLKNYEKYVKRNFDGPFFEITNTFIKNWPRAGLSLNAVNPSHNLELLYPILDSDGNYHEEIDTKKFRKAFATATLLKKISKATNPGELVEYLKKSLRHKNFDTTFSNYLMATNAGRGVIDSAIVAITTSKLEEGIKFRGKILAEKNNRSKNKKVFLCECEDPFNPSHDVFVAAECRHYDLCLGCKRSVITSEHLPRICARIIQYEQARKYDWTSWSMMYEDRWMIAHDALSRYMEYCKDGKELVERAWAEAKAGTVWLPPVIEGGL